MECEIMQMREIRGADRLTLFRIRNRPARRQTFVVVDLGCVL